MTADQNAVETAWKIHAAVVDWTGKVDTKASFTLTIEAAVLGGVIALAGGQRRLSGLAGVWENAAFWLGITALVSAAILSALVVRPQLKGSVAAPADQNFVYFGHLRLWNEHALDQALRTHDMLPILSRQLISMSAIAWTKYKRLQWSMNLLMAGTALVAIAVILNVD